MVLIGQHAIISYTESFINYSNILRFLALIALLSPIGIWAAWNDGVNTGPYTYGSASTGFHIPVGGSENIRQWTGCKTVAPLAAAPCNSGAGIFVPTRTSVE